MDEFVLRSDKILHTLAYKVCSQYPLNMKSSRILTPIDDDRWYAVNIQSCGDFSKFLYYIQYKYIHIYII